MTTLYDLHMNGDRMLGLNAEEVAAEFILDEGPIWLLSHDGFSTMIDTADDLPAEHKDFTCASEGWRVYDLDPDTLDPCDVKPDEFVGVLTIHGAYRPPWDRDDAEISAHVSDLEQQGEDALDRYEDEQEARSAREGEIDG
jgi:hypothetical protein